MAQSAIIYPISNGLRPNLEVSREDQPKCAVQTITLAANVPQVFQISDLLGEEWIDNIQSIYMDCYGGGAADVIATVETTGLSVYCGGNSVTVQPIFLPKDDGRIIFSCTGVKTFKVALFNVPLAPYHITP